MITIENKNSQLSAPQQDYETLVDGIDNLWSEARNQSFRLN